MSEVAHKQTAEPAGEAAVSELRLWQERLAAAVEHHSGDDGSHDLAHCERVWRVARQIAEEIGEPVDRLVLLAAAYLHDIVALEKNDPRRSWASRMAAAQARGILLKMGFASERLSAVSHAIEAHSFSAGIAARSIEAKILQDADRMDTLGAIGLARIFYVGGRIGTKLFDDRDPLAEHRDHDDRRFTLDHFHTKILRLPELMNTEPARILAQERVQFIELFLTRLLDEAGIADGVRRCD